MELITERGREEAPGRPAVSSENAGGWAKGGSGLRKASEIVAVVCAGVLAGGGAGMLGGVALGAKTVLVQIPWPPRKGCPGLVLTGTAFPTSSSYSPECVEG